MLDIKLEKQLPVVQMNFEEVKASLILGAEKYKNIIVTEENLKDCKVMQKELSKTKTILDTYRKTIKKEMIIPITKFEEQCKELIQLVTEVETPTKEAIAVFDDAAREAKKLMAQEHINKAITDLLLDGKHGSQLIVLDEYMNVSMSVKKVKEDIERRSLLLQQAQQQEAENLQIIKDTIENCNKNIDAKMYLEDFQNYIDIGTALPMIIHNINARTEKIKANELKAIADKAAKAEKEVLERIAKAEFEAAEKARIEERNIRIAKEAAEDVERLRQQNLARIERELEEAEQQKEIEQKLSETIIELPIDLELIVPLEKQYFIEMRVEGTLQEIKDLSQFLKVNNYHYIATDKGEK